MTVKMNGSEKQVKWANDIRENLKFAYEIFNMTTFNRKEVTADPMSRRYDKEMRCMTWDKLDEWNYRDRIKSGYKAVMTETAASKLINIFKGMKRDRLEDSKEKVERDKRYEEIYVINFYNKLVEGGYIKESFSE